MQGHIESAVWADRNRTILLVRGWVVGHGSKSFPRVRMKGPAATIEGYCGLRRPDLAIAFPQHADALHGGFSIFGRPGPGAEEFFFEAASDTGDWENFATLTAGSIGSPHDGHPEFEIASLLRAEERGPKPVVLFVSHDIAQAGAQLFLLRLLQALKGTTPFEIEVLVDLPREYAMRAAGPEADVLAGFKSIGRTHFLSQSTLAPENLPEIRAGKYGLVYANTLTLGCLTESLQSPCPIVSHAHELGFWLEKRTGLETVARQVRHSDRFIACSRAVKEYMVARLSVSGESIQIIHEFASTKKAMKVASNLSKADARKGLGIPAGAFVFAACGTFDWRKGADLFLPICIALRRLMPDREFRGLWVGPFGAQLVRDQFDHEAQTSGLKEFVSLLGAQSEPLNFMRAADCFALPSREDPFPIVMLEAATLGLPVVGFDGSGGVVEFAENGAGIIVPYMDVEAFAAALVRFANEPDLAVRYGREGASRVARLYDESLLTSRIRDLICDQLGTS